MITCITNEKIDIKGGRYYTLKMGGKREDNYYIINVRPRMAAAVLLFQKYIAGWVVGLVSQENQVYILGNWKTYSHHLELLE